MVLSPIARSLYVRDIGFSYNGKAILANLSFSLQEGKTLAVLGPSGIGKSTLLKLILGNIHPHAGTISFHQESQPVSAGVPFSHPNPSIALVPQEKTLLPWLDCTENVAIPLSILERISRKEALALSADLLHDFGLSNVASQYPESLSGGQYVRIQLIRALAVRPQLLLLDEITNAIDPATILEIIKLLGTYLKRDPDRPPSLILVTHSLKFASALADLFLFIHSPERHELITRPITEAQIKLQETKKFLEGFAYV